MVLGWVTAEKNLRSAWIASDYTYIYSASSQAWTTRQSIERVNSLDHYYITRLFVDNVKSREVELRSGGSRLTSRQHN